MWCVIHLAIWQSFADYLHIPIIYVVLLLTVTILCNMVTGFMKRGLPTNTSNLPTLMTHSFRQIEGN